MKCKKLRSNKRFRLSNNSKKYLFSLGSMVQNGKFSAAASLLVRTLKNVDLPTFGIPTIPTFRFVPTRPMSGFFSGASTFFGGMTIAHLNDQHRMQIMIIHNQPAIIIFKNG
jgi:hypothetical protein